MPGLRILACLPALLTCFALSASTRTEYRGFWVDTFNTSLNNHQDVVATVRAAQSSKANALFAQVRRRGDAWYLNSLEPPPDFTPFAPGFDPLRDLIDVAHASGIEVHAFVIMGAIWNKNPTFAPTATLGPPLSPDHVFNEHSGFDPTTGRIEPGASNWLTRSLLPDGSAGIGFQGHRFGSDFWLDFGHPDAAANSVELVLQLVRSYDIDGLHLDRIRYPDFSATGQTPATGTSIGYNAVSVYRFQEHYAIPHDAPPPLPNDPLWSQWRRDQVTNVVRRIYLNAVAIRPGLKVSAALIAFGGGPVSEESWKSAEAYWRVYQDWRAWIEEGILDIAIPMNYKREDSPQQALWYDEWNEWTRQHQYSRMTMPGIGIYLNSIEGSLRQIRRALAPSDNSNTAFTGVNLYALATPDAAVENNPYAIPVPQSTPVRGIVEFASAVTSGRSVDGSVLYGNDGSLPVFFDDARVPVLPWKSAPQKGHLMGFARSAGGLALDTATVYIYNAEGHVERTTATDGGGFFGAVDLRPGRYVILVELGGERQVSNAAQVVAGDVANVTFPVIVAADKR